MIHLIKINLIIVLSFILNSCSNTVPDNKVVEKFLPKINKILTMQKKISFVHPFLKHLYPVVMLENNNLYIFDYNTSSQKYEFIKKTKTPYPMPKNIQASFPLAGYNNKSCCVISEKTFSSISGYAIIFHEFIHCRQVELGEQKLKNTLEVNNEAMANKDYMWEISYKFPYQNKNFEKIYSQYLENLKNNSKEKILRNREQLKNILSSKEYEYFVWQEWKEGFARYIENKIRKTLDIKLNNEGEKKPFNRISFYVSGSRYINFLIKNNKELSENIEQLFYEIRK